MGILCLTQGRWEPCVITKNEVGNIVLIQRGSAILANAAPAVCIAADDLDAGQQQLRAQAIEKGLRIKEPSKDDQVAMRKALQRIALTVAQRA